VTALNEKILLSVAEAAQVLGVCRDTVYDLAAAGRIPARKIGTRLMIPRARLEEWANAGGMTEVLAPSRQVAS
jgi:excisionase family DNA binding protein